MKEFTLLEILSLISRYMLIEKFDRLHELIEWIMGRIVFTHQIPSIADIVIQKAIEQFPQFDLKKDHSLKVDIQILVNDIKRKDEIAASILIQGMEARYGKTFLVKQG
jgi:hypothetical protein